jgi:hypothetical protein
MNSAGEFEDVTKSKTVSAKLAVKADTVFPE